MAQGPVLYNYYWMHNMHGPIGTKRWLYDLSHGWCRLGSCPSNSTGPTILWQAPVACGWSCCSSHVYQTNCVQSLFCWGSQSEFFCFYQASFRIYGLASSIHVGIVLKSELKSRNQQKLCQASSYLRLPGKCAQQIYCAHFQTLWATCVVDLTLYGEQVFTA